MIKIPDQYLRTATLLIHSLLIIVGIIVIGIGIIQSHRYDARLERDETVNIEIIELSITVGFTDIAIGVCGICAALMKLRALHITNSTLLALTLIVNLIFLVVCGIHLNLKNDKTIAIKRNTELIRDYYGINSPDSYGQLFTSNLDSYQNLYSCCGWTGIDGENAFLNAIWYWIENYNVTESNVKTLPESCCIKPGDLVCQTTKNVKEAREKGLVYKKDCLDVGLEKMLNPFSGYILQIVLSLVLQIPSAALTVTFLLPARQEAAGV